MKICGNPRLEVNLLRAARNASVVRSETGLDENWLSSVALLSFFQLWVLHTTSSEPEDWSGPSSVAVHLQKDHHKN